ncbi:TPA: hypothetical protein IAA87_07490 [Candidatus Avigastranaerophilus faecigallinarum]|nr:hypothetical protein [Candidatus Avigastranaerophilus faecigallinarum]
MLSLLFDTGFWYDLIFIAFIGFIIFLCFKYPNSRVYVFSFLGIIFVGITAYCGIQLNYYYTAEGGVWGYITGLIQTNTVTTTTVSDTAQFSLENIVLTQNSDGTYSAVIYSDDKIRLEAGKIYGVYVNDEPCTQVDSSTNYVRAEYHYAFLNNDLDVLYDDTLQFNFAFYGNGATFTLTTYGGQEAVNYWNTYFTRNNLIVEVKPIGYEKDDQLSINGQIDDYATLNYYLDDDIIYSYIYTIGSQVSKFPTAEKEGLLFAYWKDSNGNKVDTLEISSDTNLYAYFYETAEEVLLNYNLVYAVDSDYTSGTGHPSSTTYLNFQDSDELKTAVENLENKKDKIKAIIENVDGSIYTYDLLTTESSTDEYHGYYSSDDSHSVVDIVVNNYNIKLGEDFSIYFRYVEGTDYNTFQIVNEGGVSSTNDRTYFNYYQTSKLDMYQTMPTQIYLVC